ncbi:MAG TPA: peptidase, partial [Thermoanaerobaculia bacterium]|nr:peptidase [Thermoanaerobaculia bacterium]
RFCASPERDFTCEPQPEMATAHEEFARLRLMDPAVQASLERAGDSYRDERVKAVAALAPAVVRAFSVASLRRVEVPVLVVGAEADSIAPPATNADFVHANLPSSQLLRLQAVGHYTFLSGCTADGRRQLAPLCGEREGVRREAIHEQVAAAVDAFFARASSIRR